MQSFRGIQVSPHSLLCITCFCLWSIKLEEAPSWICILDGFRHYVNVSAVLIVYIFWVQVLVYGSLYVSCKFPFLWVVTVWSIDRMTYSVRALQYLFDIAVNTKIPDDLVHKLVVERFRIRFQWIERLWFNFKICGISEELLVVSSTPFWRLR